MYYTQFYLFWDIPEEQDIETIEDSITEFIMKMKDNDRFEGIAEDGDSERSLAGREWENWREDMTEMSATFPNVLFDLKAFGREREDVWQAYFKYGLVQVSRAVITYSVFNERAMLLKYSMNKEVDAKIPVNIRLNDVD